MELFLSNDIFEYEILALLKAYFPKETMITLREDKEKEEASEHDKKVSIEIEDKQIGISFFQNEIPILKKNYTIESATRREYKNSVKRNLYYALQEVTGKTLPWGTLTGVRPTKLAMELLEKGEGEKEILQYMSEQYCCTPEKIELALQITTKEWELLNEVDYKNGYSIYIGIPFCPTTCLYCSFASYPLKEYGKYMDAYLDALEKEIDYAASCFLDKKLTTVYIGGGTPTTLKESDLERLLKKVVTAFPFHEVKEFTVEAGRPDSINKEKLKLLKEYGVSRISINPQTMVQKTLDIIGRKHTIDQIKEAFFLAREANHDNINMDLIMGLPGEELEDVVHTLEEIKLLNPDSITIHSLAIKRAADLNMKKGQYEGFGFGDVEAMLHMGENYAKECGYKPYYLYRQKNAAGSNKTSRENIGYARPGKEGLYNILTMEEKQTILALGAGASSKFVFPNENKIERVENVKSIKDYIERIDEMIDRKRSFIEKNCE